MSNTGAAASNTNTPTRTTVPVIWESVSDFANMVIFHDACMKVKAKIEHGTLAGSYDIADRDGTAHRDILLTLKGKFTLEDFPGDQVHDYAQAHAGGISFNKTLVMASQTYYAGRGFGSVDDALNDLEGLSYSAVFQETLEHELAHLKNHNEKMADPGILQITQPDSPLYRESGYSVQRKIRTDNGFAHAQILDVDLDCVLRGWMPPLKLRHSSFEVTESPLKEILCRRQNLNEPLTMVELKQNINYGAPLQSQREHVTEGGSRKRLREENQDDNAGTHGRSRSPFARSKGSVAVVRSRSSTPAKTLSGEENRSANNAGVMSTVTLESSKMKNETEDDVSTPVKTHSGQDTYSATSAGTTSTLTTESSNTKKRSEDDGEEDLHQLFLSLQNQKDMLQMARKSERNATTRARFCGASGKTRTSFAPSEDIFLELTFVNESAEDVFVKMYRGRFGRDSVIVQVEGQTDRYLPTGGRQNYVIAKIPPGESHTFARRKLCGGPNGRTDDRGRNVVPCWTPEKPGTYYVKIAGRDDATFPFQIED